VNEQLAETERLYNQKGKQKRSQKQSRAAERDSSIERVTEELQILTTIEEPVYLARPSENKHVYNNKLGDKQTKCIKNEANIEQKQPSQRMNNANLDTEKEQLQANEIAQVSLNRQNELDSRNHSLPKAQSEKQRDRHGK
jgi:hypothetical protein